MVLNVELIDMAVVLQPHSANAISNERKDIELKAIGVLDLRQLLLLTFLLIDPIVL